MKHKALRHYLSLATFAALILFGFTQNVTDAKLTQCRGDPLFILSDGTVVDVSEDIETLPLNVTAVQYVLHIPAGLSVVTFVHTPAWLTSVETLTVYADKPAHQYSSTTTVYAGLSTVGVTAHMLVNLGSGDASGVSGQPLTITLTTN